MNHHFTLLLALAALLAPAAPAQSTYLFNDSENGPAASGSGSFDLNSHGPQAVYSITVEAAGSIGGQVNGPYTGSASVSLNSYQVDDREGPMNGSTHAGATISLTNITRRGDGHWIADNGWDLGSGSVAMSATVSLAGDGYGDSQVYAYVSWTVSNTAPTVSWNAVVGAVASGQTYTISAHGHDPDGNLAQVNVWKNGQPFAVAAGGSGYDADGGNPTSDPGPQTITFTAQAVDATGATSATISQTVTVAAPPPPQYTLTASADAGGSVSGGGTFPAGSTVTVNAVPEAMYDFAGWSGDASGTASPVSVVLDRNKTVQAGFTLKTFVLATSATAGGSVTPGGAYPCGTIVSISAAPDATHYFVGWSGDASGTATSVAITLDRSKNVQALFSGKTAQTITFSPPGDRATGSAPFALSATASSGLPVTFTVVSGPATLSNGLVQLTGPGVVSIQASQPGDARYLPAAPVMQSFKVTAPVALKYRGATRALLANRRTTNGTPLIVQIP